MYDFIINNTEKAQCPAMPHPLTDNNQILHGDYVIKTLLERTIYADCFKSFLSKHA